MKKILFIFAVFALAQASFAQASKVPAAAKATFAKAYPNADDIKWELEGGNYEVEFEIADDQEMTIVYDAAGNLLETEVQIAPGELPAAVQESLKGKKIKEAAKITNAKGIVTYEAEVKRKDLLFDAQGKRLN